MNQCDKGRVELRFGRRMVHESRGETLQESRGESGNESGNESHDGYEVDKMRRHGIKHLAVER